MKKILSMLAMLLLTIGIVGVSAGGYCTLDSVKLVQKDPVTWIPIANGLSANFRGYADCVKYRPELTSYYLNTYKLEKGIDYTLIYYGNAGNNDVWNYATCMGTIKGTGGYQFMTVKYNYAQWLKPDIAEKFWLVLSSDVDCVNGIMTAWNPSEYLFETKTL